MKISNSLDLNKYDCVKASFVFDNNKIIIFLSFISNLLSCLIMKYPLHRKYNLTNNQHNNMDRMSEYSMYLIIEGQVI
jgi:hypothetical protein